jgi:phage terminase large subunit-like protein
VLTLAASRDQAQVVFGYALAFLRNSPILSTMIKSVTAHEIRLTNNVVLAIHSNSYRLIRGRSLLAVIFDEVGHWRDELSSNPDLEVYRAVRPSLARHANSI